MFKLSQALCVGAASLVLSLSAAASAQSSQTYASQFGAPAENQPYGRQVFIDPHTRWINVTEGEVVKFVIRAEDGSQTSFTWSFDTFGERFAELGRLAPEGVLSHRVKVFIAYDPRYRGQ